MGPRVLINGIWYKTTLSERCGLFAEHFIDTLRRAMKKGPVSDDGALVP